MKSKSNNLSRFTPLERRSVAALSCIYALRMFGLFLILPVLSIYTDAMHNATPLLIGVALGAYGFTQALLQIPFGMLSDRLGRKRVITFGLLLFIIGSLVAAASSDIVWVIVGRALQGAGAIAAAVLALTADLTRENQRSKAMAFIGMSIGLAFMLALLFSTLLAAKIGFSGLFLLTAGLAVLAIIVLWLWVPSPAQRSSRDVQAVPADVLRLLRHPQLIRLDIGIFVLHFVLTAMFVVVPLLLSKQLAVATEQHWQVYLPALLVSIVAMTPLVMLSSKRHLTMRVFAAAICILLVSQLAFISWPINSVYALGVVLFVFFWGFNTLEAMLPSLVTRLSPPATKGTAVGIYNTFQFSGVFLGGLLGGWLYGVYGYQAVFVLCGILLLLWVLLVQTAPTAKLYDSKVVSLAAVFAQHHVANDAKIATRHQTEQISEQIPEQRTGLSSRMDNTQLEQSVIERVYQQLSTLSGVQDVTVIVSESVAYLKVDALQFDMAHIAAIESGEWP